VKEKQEKEKGKHMGRRKDVITQDWGFNSNWDPNCHLVRVCMDRSFLFTAHLASYFAKCLTHHLWLPQNAGRVVWVSPLSLRPQNMH
jgi:hypothetical protein